MCIHFLVGISSVPSKPPELWIHKPQIARHGDAFEAVRVTPPMFGREGDPFLNLDHFRMRGPTFPPHAHAGFSAVTYLLPESAGGMRNRDGRGDHSLIRAGGLHWTAAGSGVVHEEVPEPDGVVAEGLQIFIRQPPDQERMAPVIHHLEPDELPRLTIGEGAWLRVIAGSFAGARAPIEPPSPLQLLDVALSPGTGIEWRNPWPTAGATIYLFSGAIDVDGAQAAAPAAIVCARGTPSLHIAATIGDARFVVLAGEPLDAPTVSNGPFALSSVEALEDAVARYRRGEMGSIVQGS